MGPDGNWVEVQIRSRRMDEIAEKGFAAHWKYKIGEGDEESELNAWLKTIKDILDNPEPSAIDFLNTLKLNLFSSEIVVFTPAGELLTLPAGATVLDLAFALHTEIGIHCIAGKVNHKLVPLHHVLRSGDQTEVLTSKTQTPQPEWANFLVTAKAKTRLRQALRRMRQPQIEEGRKILAEWMESKGIPDNNAVMTKLMGLYHVGNRDELCYQLGGQEIMLGDYLVKSLRKADEASKAKKGMWSKIIAVGKKVIPTVGSNEASASGASPEPDRKENLPVPQINTKETYALRTRPEGGANFLIADCCKPIPGDDVLGFITDSGDVEIHTLDCPQAQLLKAGYGSRILATRWDTVTDRYLAHIIIEGIDRHGILQELISMISTHMGIDIRKLDIEASSEVFVCDLWVRVSDTSVVADLCSRAREIKGVQKAARTN